MADWTNIEVSFTCDDITYGGIVPATTGGIVFTCDVIAGGDPVGRPSGNNMCILNDELTGSSTQFTTPYTLDWNQYSTAKPWSQMLQPGATISVTCSNTFSLIPFTMTNLIVDVKMTYLI